MKETDFLYISARVRAMETGLLTKERFHRLSEAQSTEEALSLLAEAGFPTAYKAGKDGSPVPDVEATIFAPFRDALALAETETPSPRTFDFVRLPYDVCNLKAVIKCDAAGVSPDDMLFSCGRVGAEDAVRAVRERDFSRYPSHIAAAADRAAAAYAEARDPRKIDLILDEACFADMLDAVKEDEFLTDLVRRKIDLINIMTRLRVLRGGTPVSLFREAFLAGGTLGESFFPDDDSESALGERLRWSETYASLFDADPAKLPFSALEKAEDEYFAARVSRAKYVPFGAAVVGAYLIARENETKNLRILMTSVAAGRSGEEVRERLRTAGV